MGGQRMLNWVYQYASETDITGVKQSMQGADTFNSVFSGDDLAEWFELRKEAICAGNLPGKPKFLEDGMSEAKLKVTFTPEGDEMYIRRYEIKLEHGRKYYVDIKGQGTSDEELIP